MFGQMGQQGMQGIQQMNHAHPGGINAVLLDGSVRTFGAQVDLSEPQDWFVENSFSFGVEREMKESGEKGGTEDAANLQSFTKVMLRTDQDFRQRRRRGRPAHQFHRCPDPEFGGLVYRRQLQFRR